MREVNKDILEILVKYIKDYGLLEEAEREIDEYLATRHFIEQKFFDESCYDLHDVESDLHF